MKQTFIAVGAVIVALALFLCCGFGGFYVLYRALAKDIHRTTYVFVDGIEAALAYLHAYEPADLGSKVF